MTRSTQRPSTVRRFSLKPMSLALALGSLSTMAWSSPFTGLGPTQNVSIEQSGKLTTITQSAQVGQISTQGFGIGAQEAVRALQPNNGSLLINVTGAARSDILGALTANGRVLISNPYGIYFGAGAQINVGSLVATTLGIDSSELMSSRIRLKDNGQSLGSVVNAGSINASGTVVLAGPTVVNEGSINAARVGLAASSDVLVDVEGDGLIFFEMNGAKAGQRLSQLGRITADGGTVDLRAAARGAMADTVLNLEGIVQARSLGTRQGQVYIDGGSEGRTVVSGRIDVSGQGSGEQGGQASVRGQRVDLLSTASIDARGQAGGGTILVGGNYHGMGTERRAQTSVVEAGARLDASAIQAGNGGQVVVWADDLTLFSGSIYSQGGSEGGNGGDVEVSGKLRLGYDGHVNTLAPKGLVGNLLLDPQDITIVAGGTTPLGSVSGVNATTDITVDSGAINAAAANVTLTASRDIFVNAEIKMTSAGAGLTLTGQSIKLGVNGVAKSGDISTNGGDITLNGSIVLSGDSAAASTVTIAGRAVNLNGGINSDGVQTRSLDVTGTTTVALGAAGASGRIGGTTAIGDLTLATAALTITADTITAAPGSNATIKSLSSANQIAVRGASGNTPNALILRESTLAKFNGFSSLTLGSGSNTILFDVGTWIAPTKLIFKDAVTLGSNTVINASAIDVEFQSTITGARDLTINSTGITTFNGNVTGLTTLTTNAGGTTNINGDVQTSGLQNYGDSVALGGTGTRSFSANDLTFGGNLDMTGHNLSLTLDNFTLTGNVTGAGGQAVTIATLSDDRAINVESGILGLDFSATTLNKFSSASSLTLGRTDSDSVITLGAYTLGTNTALIGSAVDIDGTLTLGTKNIDIRTNELTVAAAANITGTGTATLSTLSDARAINVNNGTTGLDLSSATFAKFAGVSQLTLGRASSDSAITVNASTLPTDLSLVNGNASITLSGATTGAGFDLVINSGGTTTLGGTITGLASITTDADRTGAGTTNIDTNITTTGAQSYGDSVVLGGAAGARELRATALSLANLTVTGHDLVVRTDELVLSGSITGAGGQNLTVSTLSDATAINLNNGTDGLDISTATLAKLSGFTQVTLGRSDSTGTLTAGALTLPTALRLIANQVDLTGAITLGANSLGILADEFSASAALSGAGTVSLATRSNDRVINVNVAGDTSGLDISAATLGQFGGVSQLTLGRADSASLITTENITLPTALTLVSSTNTIDLTGTTLGNGKALIANTSGATSLTGSITGLLSLSTDAAGTTLIGADVATTGAQNYGDAVTLGGAVGARELRASSLSLASIDVNGHDLQVRADEFSVAGTVTGAVGQVLTLSTLTDGTAINLNNGSTGLDISSTTLAKLAGFDLLSVGRADSGSAITANAITLPTALSLFSSNGTITLSGATVGAGKALSVNTSGTTNLGLANSDTLTGLASLSTDAGGTTNVNTNITTTGAQTYGDAVVLGGAAGTRELRASSLQLNNLNLNGRDLTARADEFSLSGSLTVDAGRALALATLTDGTAINLNNGTAGLDLDAATLAKLNGLTQLTLGRADSASTITANDITLPTALSLVSSSGTVTLSGATVGAGKALTVNTSGTTNLGLADTDTLTGLASITTDAGGTTNANTDISTTGAQTYGDALALGGAAGARELRASALSLADLNVTGHDLVLRANEFSLSGTVSGTTGRSLSLASLTSGLAININNGASGLDLDAATLARLGDFVQLTLGRSDSASNITAAGITLPTSLSLVSSTGSVTLSGTTTGASKSLTVNTAGVTTLGGTLSGLSGITTDAGGSTSISGNVSTTGAQSYGDNVTLGGAGTHQLSASSLSFGGNVDMTGHDLSILADEFSLTGNLVNGAGRSLTLANLSNGVVININNGTFGLDISTDTLAKFSSLSNLVIGNNNSTFISTGLWTLPTDVKLIGALVLLNTTTATAGHNLDIVTNDLGVSGAVSGGGNASIATLTPGLQINLENGGAGLAISALSIAQFSGVDQLTIGRLDSLSAIKAGALTLNTKLRLIGSSVELNVNSGDSTSVGSNTLSILTNAFSAGGTITGTGNVNLATLSDGLAIDINTGGGTGLLLTQSTMDAFTGFSLVTIGRSDSNSVITVQDLSLSTDLTLVSALGNVTLAGNTQGKGFDLSINTSGTTQLGGTLSGLGSLSTNAGGATQILGDISTSGAQSYGDSVTLGGIGVRTLSASSLSLGDLTLNGLDLNISADEFNLSGAVFGAAGRSLGIATLTNGVAINLNNGTTGLDISTATLGKLAGFDLLTIGRASSASAIEANGITLGTNLTLVTGGAATFTGATVGNGKALVVNAGGLTTLGGTITGLASLSTDALGDTQIDTDISTTGAQSYGDAVTLGGTGARSLRASALSLANLDVTGHELIIRTDEFVLSGGVAGATGQSLSLSTLTTGLAININNATTGLDISSITLSKLNDFASLTFGRADSASSITANGITLPANLSLISSTGDIGLTGVTTGAGKTLTVNTSGATTLGGSITGLASVNTDAGGSTQLNTDISTTGAQSYGDNVVLGGAATQSLRASSLSFGGNLNVTGHSLDVLTDEFALTGTITGSAGQTLSLATLTNGVVINLNSGTTGLDISTITLGKFNGFDALTLGRSSSAGQINASGITLPTALTLVSSTGNITINGATGAGKSLTVNTSGTTTLEGTITGLASLTTDLGGTSQINTDIDTTGAQNYGDNVSIGGAGNRLIRATDLSFTGTTLSVGNIGLSLVINTLTLSSTVSAPGTQALSIATFSDGRNISLGGATGANTLVIDGATLAQFNPFTSLTVGRSNSASNITASNLTLPTALTLVSSLGDINLSGTTTGAGKALTINTAGTTALGGSITGLASINTDAGGSTQINTNISTAGAQTYLDAVVLGGAAGARELRASALSLASIDVNGHDLTVRADEFVLTGSVSNGSGTGSALSLSSLTDGTAINLNNGSDGLDISDATLVKLSTFTQLTLGRADSASTIVATGITLPTALTLVSSTGNISLNGLTGSAGKALIVNTSGATTLGGTITGLSSITTDAGGTTQINADISTTGAQTYGDNVALGGAALQSLQASSLSFGGNLTVTGHSLDIRADAFALAGTITGAGGQTLSLSTATNGLDININTGSTGLLIGNATLAKFTGFDALTLGRTDSASNITTANMILPTAVSLVSSSNVATGNINISGNTTGVGKALTINTIGTTTLAGTITNLLSLTTDAGGTTELAGTIATSGAQTYNDRVDVSGNAALSSTGGADIVFSNAINGKTAGSGQLSINTTGNTSLQGPIGQDRLLGSLSVTNASGTTSLFADISTSGTVTLQGAVTLSAAVNIAHGGLTGLTFGSTVNGAFSLGINSASDTTFNGLVTVSSLSTTGSGTVIVSSGASGISTTGAQSYGGDIRFTGIDKTLSASSLTFAGDVTGANGLTLSTNALTQAAGKVLNGTGVLTIKALSNRNALNEQVSIDVAGGFDGSGQIQVTQDMLSSATGFSQLVIGDTVNNNRITVGAANLGTHTTLQSNGGDIRLVDVVNSVSDTVDATTFFDLNINTSGDTYVFSSQGTRNALGALITDSPGQTILETTSVGELLTIRTTGNIEFNDTLTTTSANVSLRSSGGVVQALAANFGTERILGVSALRADVRSSGDLTLSQVQLTGTGESQIISDGVLTLTGNVSLANGSLLLQSNATPTTLADFTADEFKGKILTVGLSAALGEASLGIEQKSGGILTAEGTHLSVRTTQNASISLMSGGNDMKGTVSAVAGRIGENPESLRTSTPLSDGKVRASFLRIQSKQLNVAGTPLDDSDQNLRKAGLESDVIELNLDGLNTNKNNGLIRARLPYDNNQGALTAMPALTINVSAIGLNTPRAFGGVEPESRIAVSVGNSIGSYVTVKPKNGAFLGPGYVSLGGATTTRPFYDGSGKVTEVPVFYNGDVPQSPQAVGALSAVTAVIEEARRARFEEAVRTENVSSRLRSGVIAEVGSGRPATEGSDSLRAPQGCTPAGNSLSCQ